jgi:hypothetical protein
MDSEDSFRAERAPSEASFTSGRAPKFAKRLDCGDFSTAFRAHQDYPPFQVLRPLDSAAKAGALQTLRDKDQQNKRPTLRSDRTGKNYLGKFWDCFNLHLLH